MVPPGKKPAGETSNSNKKCKRYFNEHWKEEFTWLEFDYERKLMFCVECRQALVKNKHGKAENAFTVGTDNFQRHALLRHVTSGAHRQALAVNREQVAFESRGHTELSSVLKVEVNPAKVAVLTTVYWMAKEEILDEKCSSLLDLQKFNLCQALLASEHSERYHAGSLRDMQAAMAKVLHNEDRHRIKASPFVGLVVDETVDAMEHRSLAVFSTTVSPCSGQTSATFLGSFELLAGEATTVTGKVGEVLRAFGIPAMKLTWLSAHSASLGAERRSGAGNALSSLCPLLTEMHCLSHGSSLLPTHSSLSIEYLQKYETTVDAIYRLYSSPIGESSGLQELWSVLDLCEIDLGSPRAICWTSIFPAVEAIDSSWPTLVLLLESEAERSPVALGLCQELKKFHFVAFTKILLDVLPIFQKLSRFFQIEDFDLSILKPIVSATATTLQAQKGSSGQNLQEFLSAMTEHPQGKQEGESRLYYKGVELANCSPGHLQHFEHLKDSYLESMRGSLLDRFPSSILEAVSSFSAIFNPKCYPQTLEDIGTYGVSELNFLLQAYSQVVVSERALSDFPLFKRIVFSLSQLSFRDLCVKLVYSSSEMHELFPDFAVLAAIALALPLGSVLAKKISRGRELLKRGRSRCTKDEGLSNLMKIAIDGPAIDEFDFALAIEYYESMRESGFIKTQVK
ncbi:transmembrane protein C17orf113 homolog [Coturnix japonica]|uniref:Zinc finger protein 862-like n=1 Tax=Coturnix japonica TaxID=93934 RepID=A0A8C2T133_COTJA|nr:transmembrane protein C17orf113 homolog [Coturnix japonica]XP_015741126.1 transmembrane protein C17orf113 homolog [Coturnix japonica]